MSSASSSSTPRLAVLLALLVLALTAVLTPAGTHAHLMDPRGRSFTVPPTSDDPTSISAYLTSSGGGKHKCTFTYATSPVGEAERSAQAAQAKSDAEAAAAKDKAAANAVPVAFEDVAQRLKGQCATRNFGYWDFEVCVGIRARHYQGDDSYPLGNIIEIKADKKGKQAQHYDGGAICDGRADRAPRRSVVRFGCVKDAASTPVLVDMQEPETCVYEFMIGTAIVCHDQRYPKLEVPSAASIRDRQNSAANAADGNVDDGSEDWFLSLSELGHGRVMCTAQTLEFRGAVSKLNFIRFGLVIESEASTASDDDIDQDVDYVARHSGRVPMSPHEVVVSKGNVASSDAFAHGSVAFLKTYA